MCMGRPPPTSTLFPYTTLFRSYDAILQGMGGVQSLTGEANGGPTRVGVPIGDIAAGMFPAYAVSSALFWRERDRKSTRLNSSHLGILYAVFCLKKKMRLIMHRR